MSNLLFIDENILEDSTKWGESREVFQKALTECIERNYSDDAQVYNLFTPEQRKLLDSYYKGFSREMYRELNGTVALQIQKRNENVKRKLQKLGNDFGMQLDADAWEYDGLRDVGKGAGAKCDLCPHPIRYVHYAVNKQTHECLQFGCNCAADFFAMDKGRLQSMHSIQANMLKDIKIIACVKDKQLENDYYRYSCGHFGRVYLENGVQGLKELVTFKVFWADNLHMQGDVAKNLYNIQYGDGTKAKQTLDWIKQHIVHCVNADLDNNSYKPLTERNVVPMQEKELSARQKNTAQYIIYAINFINAGIPVPPSIAKQVNTIVTSATKQHHPDYIKYAQELLMQKNLAKSALLRTAFTEFIVDYLASTARKTDRDPETACWGIKGPKTFYNTVLDWEAALTKLMLMTECDKLFESGYITEAEAHRYWRLPSNLRFTNWLGTYTAVTNYTALCRSVFLTNAPVTRDIVRLRDGLSKYAVQSGKADLVIDASLYKGDNTVLSVNEVPYKLALCFITYQNGFKALVQNTIVTACKILEGVQYTETNVDLLHYLYSVEQNTHITSGVAYRGSTQGILNTSRYSTISAETVKEAIKRYYNTAYDSNVADILTKYADSLTAFRSACTALYTELYALYNSLRSLRYVNVKKADINNDYEALMSADRSKNKNSIDYFKEYCGMLSAKRCTPQMQQYLYYDTFMCFLAYKKMQPHVEMLKDIYKSMSKVTYKQAESQLYTALKYDKLSRVLNPFVDIDTAIPLAQYVITGWLLTSEMQEYQSKLFSKRAYTDTGITLSSTRLWCTFEQYFVEHNIEFLYKPNVLDTLIPIIRKDCTELLTGIKQVLAVCKPDLTAKELIIALGREKTYNRDALAMALSVQDIINAIDPTIRPFDSSLPKLSFYLHQLQYFPCIGDKYAEMYDKLTKYMKAHSADFIAQVQEAEQKQLAEMQQKHETETKTLHLREVLNEHIKFFEVDVTDALKRKYHTSKETAIRRREAFKLVKFETGVDELKHYMHEINAFVASNTVDNAAEKLTDDEMKYVKQAEVLLTTPETQQDKQQLKALICTLRAILYNHKCIYNHYELTHKVLKELATLDFDKLLDVDRVIFENILSVYYLCATEVETLYLITRKYLGKCATDFANEVANLPDADPIDIDAVYNNYAGTADSTGLTGVQKAEQVFNHADYNVKLDDFEKKVIKTVHVKQTCSAKQQPYVDSAYAKLFDIADSQDSTTGTNGTSMKMPDAADITTTANVDLAVQIRNHPNFESLPDTLKRIIVTVANTKDTTPKCSQKQLYYVEKAKTTLNI